MCHQVNSGSAHVDETIESLLNKNNYLVISVQEAFSIEDPTPNIFSSKSSLATSTTTIDALAKRFNQSKHTIQKGIIDK
jgi:hypothetical protein